MPTELVPNQISHDVVEALEFLLHSAKGGHVTGFVAAAMLRGRRYTTTVAGTCHKNPTHARGMVSTISDELSNLIHQRDSDDTR